MPEDESNKVAENESVSVESTSSAPPSMAVDVSPTTPELAKPIKGRKKWGLIVILVAAIAVLGGGSAAAYYAVVVPSKPENTLKKAIINTIAQKKTKFEGTLSYESTDQTAKIKAVNVTFSGSSDADTNGFSTVFDITASGLKLPIELRHVDKNIYFKVGDLSGLKGLVHSVSPAYAPTFDALNGKLANQWVEVDETLLKQANADCTFNTNLSLTPADISELEKHYAQVPFTNVKSTNSDSVNGRNATKYEVEIDDNKGAEYFKGLQNLSVVKKIKECAAGNDSQASDITPAVDNKVTPLTIWVDKNTKQIIKLASKITPKDETKSKTKLSFEVTMNYGQADVTRPEGAKPVLEVLGDFSQLFDMSNSAFPPPRVNPTQPAAINGVTQECLQAVQDYTNSGGTKPIPSCL